MEVPDGERRYTDAMLRHLMREATGEERDPDLRLHPRGTRGMETRWHGWT